VSEPLQPIEGNAPQDLGVVEVEGELDLAQAPALRARIDEQLWAGHSTIVVDMLKVTFLDSTALGVLVAALGRCREAGGDLHLIVAEPRILKVLEITGLDSSFPLHPSRTGLALFAREADPQ
jgi:anti-sigma B factor antagonist